MRPLPLALACLLAVTIAHHALSQTPPASAAAAPSQLQLSPQAAFDAALLPVEITHRSVENWSDIETAALAVAIRQAQTACAARPPAQFTGDDLISLARLCALGQQWPAVLAAADRYLEPQPASAEPASSTAPLLPAAPAGQTARALAYRIEASLRLNDPATAVTAARSLLGIEPYTALVQQSTDGLLRYLQLIQTDTAIAIAGQRQPLLLAQLRHPILPAATPTAAAEPPLSPHELYTAALALPTLLQLADQPAAAAALFAELEAALPSTLSPDESIAVAQSRRQYALLGSPLPSIPAALSLFGANETPRINTRFGSATFLLVFPDWCAQCVRMGAQFMPTLVRHAGEDVHLYGLLAQPKPPSVSAPPPPRRPRPAPGSPSLPEAAATPKSAADLLRGTPTLIVAADLPQTAFAASDFPLLVATDHAGIIRFLQLAPENAFAAGSLVDQLAAHIAAVWPPPATPAQP